MELELEPLKLPSDNERPFVIAGPCSAESEEQVMTTAKQLAMYGCHNFRAGVWKPRTKPGGFEGHGEPALVWLKQVKQETKMLVATEVATPEHVGLFLHLLHPGQCLFSVSLEASWLGARFPNASTEVVTALHGQFTCRFHHLLLSFSGAWASNHERTFVVTWQIQWC